MSRLIGPRARAGIGACSGFVLALALLACSPAAEVPNMPVATSTPEAAAPGPEATRAAAATPETAAPPPSSEDATVTLKVMSFNVLWGAGAEGRFDENIPGRFRDRDRVPELLAFLRQADPDVLAVQEAAGWDTGAPSVAEQIATELGLSYVLAPDAWELHVVLFSRYPIVAADYVSRLQDFNGVALRATLAVTPDVEVNVIAVHLNSMSSRTRGCQVEALLDMAAGLEGRTVLLGDMNFRPASEQAAPLIAGGWQLVAAQERWPIDQVWVDGSGSVAEGGWWEGLKEPEDISDHWPIGAEITFASPTSPGLSGREAVSEAQAMAYACPLQR